MKKKIFIVFFPVLFLFTMTGKSQDSRSTIDFNFDWRFARGENENASEPDYDDSRWRKVRLPHDWSVEEEFSEQWAGATAFLPGGIGWYRKSFLMSEEDKNRSTRQ